MKKLLLFLLFTLFLVSSFSVFAQDPCIRTSEGREFWVGFLDHDGTTGIDTKLYVTSRVAATGTVSATAGTVVVQNINVPANGSQQINLTPTSDYLVNAAQLPQNKGVFVSVSDPISLYALNRKLNSADVALIFPLEALGTEYYTMSFTPNGWGSVFLIVATEDNTAISVTPSRNTSTGSPANTPIDITLNRGQTYLVRSSGTNGSNSDLTGSLISSDKPIAVFSGNVRVNIDGNSSDHAYEQIPSINTWGRNFVTVPSVRENPAVLRSYDYFRIMAQADGTVVTISGQPAPITLNRGEYHTFSTQGNNTPRTIDSTQPIMVGQFTISDQFGGVENADPYFIVLSPNQQTLKDINLEALATGNINTFHVDVVTKTTNTANILLDGTPMTFDAIAGSNMSYARRNVSPGTYTLTNSSPANDGFIAYVYGYGNFESYGYLAGSSLETVVDVADDVAFCDGVTTDNTLEAPDGFIRYEWRLLPDPTIISTSQDITVTVSGSYELTTENADGCIKTDVTEVIFSPPAIADIKYQGSSVDEIRLCDSLGQQTISGFDVSHTTDNSYIWRIAGDPTIIGTNANLVVDNFSATTVYELEVVNAATQCSSAGNGSTFDEITVIFDPTHDVDIVFDGATPDIITFCDTEGEQTIEASLTPLPNDVTYRWFKDGVLMPTETSNTLVVNEFSSTTRYKVEALRPDQTLSCSQTDEIVVTFYPVALIQHNGVISNDELFLCNAEGAQTIRTGIIDNPQLEYKWRDITDPANPIDLGTDFELVVDNFSSTTIYEITITDLANGASNTCPLTDVVTVTFVGSEIEIREVGQTNDPDELTFCAEDGSRVLEAIITPSIPSSSEIKWFEKNGSVLTQIGTGTSLNIDEFQPNIIVTKTYIVQISNPRVDCISEDEIIINFLPPLGLGLIGSTDICDGDQTPITFRLSGSFPMTLTYRKTPLTGSPIIEQVIVGTPTTSSPFDYIVQSQGGTYQALALTNDLCELSPVPNTVVEVTVTPKPDVTISSPDTSVCANQTTKFVASGATNYVFYKNGLPMPTGAVANEYEPIAGTFQNGDRVWVIGEINGCPDTSRIMTMIIYPLPVVDLGVDKYKCKTDTAFLVAPEGDFIYDWKKLDTDGNPISIGNGNDTLFVLDTGTYFIRLENAITRCSSISNRVKVFNFDDEVVVDLGEDRTICSPADLPYRLTGSDLSHLAGTTYQWYVAGQNTIIGTDSIFDVTEENTYSLVVQDPRGCQISDTVRINFAPTPEFVITGHENPNCSTFDTLRIERSNVKGMIINWFGNGIVSTSDSSKVAIVNVSGTYTATITDTTTSANCSYTQSVEVFVRPNIDLGITTTATSDTLRICEGDSLVLDAFRPEHNNNFTYQWRVIESNTVVSTKSKIAIKQSMIDNYIANRFEVKVTDPNLTGGGTCSILDTIIVRFDRKSGVQIDSSFIKTLCLGQTQTLSAVGADSYQWSNGETTQTIEVTPTQAGFYTFIVKGIFSTPNRCGASADTIKFRVVPVPEIDIPEEIVICENDLVEVDAFLPSHQPRYVYEWKNENTGEIIDTTAIHIFKQESSNINYEPQTYRVGVYDTLGGGRCGAESLITVTFNRSATTKIIASDTLVCVGEQITLRATGATNFLWNTGETTQEITFSSDSAGIFRYTVIGSYGDGTNQNVCQSTEKSILVQFKAIPTVTLNTPDSISICAGESVEFIANGGATYTWSHSPTASGDTIVVNPTNTTTYILTGFDTLGCSSTDTTVVLVQPKIDLGADKQLCEGDTAIIGAERPEGATYLWNTGQVSDSIRVRKSGLYYVEVSINECSYTDSIRVDFKEAPMLSAKDTILCFEDENSNRILHQIGVTINNYDSMATYRYQWFDENNELVGQDSLLSTEFGGSYLVRVTAAYPNACNGITSLEIESNCDPQIFIPSAFTPNNDNINEEWEIFGRFYSNLRIKVLDRWGMEVYSTLQKRSDDEITFWDGTYKGKKVPAGVYYYEVTYTNPTDKSNTIKQTGTVTIIY